MTKILILEHSKSMRNSLRERLDFENYSTEATDDETEASELWQRKAFDVMIADSDYRLPEMSDIPTIVITSHPSIPSAVEALKGGAVDYLPMPIDMNRLLGTLRTLSSAAGEGKPDTQITSAPRTRQRRPSARQEQMIGRSESIERVRRMIDRVAPSDARVLIMGENGTGKELVARSMHLKSARRDGPFVEVNCAAIPAELIESELFGHEKGSFTSAVRQRKGKFELADGGTLFMDEIGDMSLSAQAKVLRALQENKITRVGGDKDISVDVRVVAATNKNIRDEISRGNFREDLYHRLSVIVIHVPPLRERKGDVELLVDHFIDDICKSRGRNAITVDEQAMAELSSMPWTGNVRQLRNAVERLTILCNDRITADDVRAYCLD
ncbi:MAG: sigma-54-dependent Fis family transcriptional regulator [Alistipes sp.]|nr:sigma-54-dependent Fis family transcriptional regulator [Alistipes sp.]